MTTQTPKKWTSRMGGVMRRASTALISPARPGTPDQGERTSTDIEREDDAASTSGKKPKKSRSNTSLSALFTRSTTPPPQPAAAPVPHQPSPIAESPAREAEASQEDPAAPGAVKSPLSQEVKLANPTDPQSVASPTGEYVPPPIIDNSGAGPGAFTDDVDDLPSSDPIPDPYLQQAANPTTSDAPVAEEVLQPQHPSPPPIDRASSDATQLTEPSLIPTAQNSTDLLVSSGGEQEGPQDRSAPIPIPQHRGTFFEHLRSSPEDHDDEILPPAPAPLPPQPQPRSQTPPLSVIPMPVPIPIVSSPSQQEHQPPRTPPRQVYLDTYTSEHEPWSGQSQRSIEETPMSIPPRAVARSLTSSDSSEDMPVSRSLENPFDDPIAPRIPPQHPQHGNGNVYSSSEDNPPAMMTMPAPLVPGNSKSKSGFLGIPKAYGADSDSDESQPLIHSGKTQKTGNPSSYTFNTTAGPLAGRYTFEQHEAATPPRLRENGWVEVHLPDSYVYYVNPNARVVADVELRHDRLFVAVSRHLEMEQHKDALEAAPEGAELWLRDVGTIKKGFIPVRWWVDHKERSVVFDKAFDVAIKKKVLKRKKEDEDQLDLEYRYWAFVEAHPSHVVLEPRAKQEAYEAINWAMTERLLPSQSPIPAPFSQEECGTLLDLLNRFDNDKNRQVDAAIQTRTIARILLRVAQWRQQHFRPNKPLPKDVTAKTAKAPTYRRPFPRILLDFTISCLCLGIPYFFLDRSRDHRVDEESGLRTAAPMFVIGACTCIMASIVLSASVTFLTLSGLDSMMRIAGFVALISAIFSMASTLLAILTIKADLERPPQVIGGEGLLMLSKRSVVMSLPVVFLLYSIIGFVTGVILFSLRGATITDLQLVRRPFNEYTRWTAAGALGAIAGMLTISFLLLKR